MFDLDNISIGRASVGVGWKRYTFHDVVGNALRSTPSYYVLIGI